MALGDGIRRNLASVSKEERDRLRDAVVKLHTQKHYPGLRNDTPVVGGVSFWFKQDEIHAHSHVHGVPAFVPWHREFVNRFEALIREVDPELSLHYWDWTQDPQALPDGEGGTFSLFTPDFLGNASGAAGDPWLTAGFYVPGATPFRSDDEFDPSNNPFDPPRNLTRDLSSGAPVSDDSGALGAATYKGFHDQIKVSHDNAHGHIGGTLGDAHTSFRDVIAFLLHSNLDRLWAMWQRDPAHPERLDPAHVYDHTAGDWSQDPEKGTGDVQFGNPWFGFKSPLEPWAGPGAQNATTGIVANVKPTRPWAPPESEELVKDCRHPSVVVPPSYDTVPHSSYMIFDRDTFSSVDVEVLPTVANAFSIVYDGFMPNELGQPIVPPTVTPTLNDASGPSAPGMTVAVGPAQLENPAPDLPQRILFPVDVTFTDPSAAFGFTTETQPVHVRAVHGGWTTDGALQLIKQPNPYMHDGSVSWLSTDVRVFKKHNGETVGGVVHPDPAVDPNAPLTFIQAVLNRFNDPSLPNDANHPFLAELTPDEQASELQLSRTEGPVPVFNYAVAKVRYVASTTPAPNVQMFFRVFSTMLSALDYNTQTNYRRGGTWPAGAPRLGLIDGEVASIPFFASPRIHSDTESMDAQPDPPNVHEIAATGAENVRYFGCWLDFNQPAPQFPLHPVGEGMFGSNRLPIPQLVRGHHSCLVAEIFFEPGGLDPIPAGATPASSDRLAQRNLAIANSGNPGNAATHTVQHTFMIHPSSGPVGTPGIAVERSAPDELLIAWHDLPRDAKATLYVPEWDMDEVLRLAARRQLPNPLAKIDADTLGLPVTELGFVPIPGGAKKDFAAMLSIVLPEGVREQQVFRVDVRQLSRSRRRFRGGFRLTIPVLGHDALLTREIRRLAVLRYIASAIPAGDRWHGVFTRYVGEAAAKVRGLGHDPDSVPASLDDPAGAAGGGRRKSWLWRLIHWLRRWLRRIF